MIAQAEQKGEQEFADILKGKAVSPNLIPLIKETIAFDGQIVWVEDDLSPIKVSHEEHMQ